MSCAIIPPSVGQITCGTIVGRRKIWLNHTLSELHDKMDEYIANCAQLGWLIDPYEARVYIYCGSVRGFVSPPFLLVFEHRPAKNMGHWKMPGRHIFPISITHTKSITCCPYVAALICRFTSTTFRTPLFVAVHQRVFNFFVAARRQKPKSLRNRTVRRALSPKERTN